MIVTMTNLSYEFLENYSVLVMQRAWRERTPSIRIQLAHDALEKNSE